MVILMLLNSSSENSCCSELVGQSSLLLHHVRNPMQEIPPHSSVGHEAELSSLKGIPQNTFMLERAKSWLFPQTIIAGIVMRFKVIRSGLNI